nr:hypothetical protein [Tanacetum cinerariifolium]
MKVALAHHRFGWIHPFSNGNGRVVRLITYALLMKYGFNVNTGGRVLNPTAVFCNDRERYYAMLTTADAGTSQGLEVWCTYVLQGIRDELNKVDLLTRYEYLTRHVLTPAIAFARQREWITETEELLLALAIKARVVKSADLANVVPNLNSAQRTYLIKKLPAATTMMLSSPVAMISIRWPSWNSMMVNTATMKTITAQIHQQRDCAGARQQEVEHRSRCDVVGEHRSEGGAGRQQDSPVRRAGFGGALGHRRRIAALAEGEEHARGGVERRVQATGHRHQHDDVDDQLGVRNAHQVEHSLIRTHLSQSAVIPGHQRDDEKDRQQVKQANPPDHRIRGLGDLLARVFRFRRRNGDDLGSHEREHGGQHRCEHRAHAVGQEALRVIQMADAADLAVRQQTEHCGHAQHHKTDDRQHFDQREPELEFAVILHAEQVGGRQ